MLSRQLVRAAAVTPRTGLRALSTSASLQKHVPSMGDVDPSRSAVDVFTQKQKAFREHLVEAQKNQEASALSSHLQAANVASAKPDESSQDNVLGRTAEAKEAEPSRKAGPLTNLIYGTKEGRELDAQLEASFSQVLARGKYVHSIVMHDVKPDKVDEYVELVGKVYPKMANDPENKVHLVGSWRTEVGNCDTFGELHYPAQGDLGLLTSAGLQFTSGNTRSTKDTTSPGTESLINPTSPSSRVSLRA